MALPESRPIPTIGPVSSNCRPSSAPLMTINRGTVCLPSRPAGPTLHSVRSVCQGVRRPSAARPCMMAASEYRFIRHVDIGARMRKFFVFAALAALVRLVPASADVDPRFATPPKAQQKPHLRTLHGETVADPYYWLREKGTPDVTTYLEAENAYTALVTRPIEPFREKLYKEFLGRI